MKCADAKAVLLPIFRPEDIERLRAALRSVDLQYVDVLELTDFELPGVVRALVGRGAR